jgi:hypothetical protein
MALRGQGMALVTALAVLIGTVVVIQLWLLSASLDALLGGETGVLWPATLASAGLCAVNGGLVWYVIAFDKRLARSGRG